MDIYGYFCPYSSKGFVHCMKTINSTNIITISLFISNFMISLRIVVQVLRNINRLKRSNLSGIITINNGEETRTEQK